MKKGKYVCEHCGGKGMVEKYVPADLRKARLAAGLSLREVAKKLHFSAAYISDIELGRRNAPEKLITFLETL